MKISARTTWIGIIIGLLSSSVIANMVVLFVYAGSPSEALEENWEARAADWDATQQQRQLNHRLGWKVEAVAWERHPTPIQASSGSPKSQVWLALNDAGGAPLSDAQLQWKAFVRARPDQIQKGLAVPAESAGQYRIDLPFHSERPLEVSVDVLWKGQRFTHTSIVDPTFLPAAK